MDAIFFCIHCGERFCSQECFGRHAAKHARAFEPTFESSPLLADAVNLAAARRTDPWSRPGL
jgi:hypothetical protein